MPGKGKWLSYKDVDAALQAEDLPYILAFERGELEVELYQPRGVDDQEPHTRDELYIVAKGSGKFTCAGETKSFVEGDALFAAAGEDHRFVDFTDDLSVWVIFYGPEGGEKV